MLKSSNVANALSYTRSNYYFGQKQSLGGVMQNRCSYKFRKFHRKTPVPSLRPTNLLKRRSWHRCFLENFAKFLRTPFLIEQLQWLLLFEVLN